MSAWSGLTYCCAGMKQAMLCHCVVFVFPATSYFSTIKRFIRWTFTNSYSCRVLVLRIALLRLWRILKRFVTSGWLTQQQPRKEAAYDYATVGCLTRLEQSTLLPSCVRCQCEVFHRHQNAMMYERLRRRRGNHAHAWARLLIFVVASRLFYCLLPPLTDNVMSPQTWS